jgi:predicted DNA-binding protein (UPF0251 family)
MPRPIKCRRVDFVPGTTYFKPAGIPLRDLEEVCLSVEELEAVRLKDLEGLEQQQGAERMNVSRPTFQRILTSARRKIADAFLNGKAVRIEGGNYEMAPRRFKCAQGHQWDVPFESAASVPPEQCPECNSTEIMPLQPAVPCCRRTGKPRCCQRKE